MGLSPKEFIEKLELGSYGHELLEAWYNGKDWRKASEEYWKEKTKNMFEEEMYQFEEVRADAELIMERYVARYAEQRSRWDIIGVEQEFEVIIPTHKGYPSQSRLYGIFDMVIQDELDNIWLVDHKITSRDIEKTDNDLVQDQQVNYYIWALNKMMDGGKVSGIIYNMLRSKTPTVPRVLKSGKSLSRAKNIDTDYETYRQAIIDNGFDVADYSEMLTHVKENTKPFFTQLNSYRNEHELKVIEKELYDVSKDIRQGRIFRNQTSNCSWDCPYRELCVMDMKGADAESYIELNFEERKRK
jgi:hypothetical protein